MVEDPFETLLVDAESLDKQRIVEALQGLLAIDRATGQIYVEMGFEKQNTKSKVLLFLLALKVSHALGKSDSERMPPGEIARSTGMASGTVRRLVNELTDSRVLQKDSKSHYYIPNPAVSRVLDILD